MFNRTYYPVYSIYFMVKSIRNHWVNYLAWLPGNSSVTVLLQSTKGSLLICRSYYSKSLLICHSYYSQCFIVSDMADPKQNWKAAKVHFKSPSFSHAYSFHLFDKAWIVFSPRNALISTDNHWIYEVLWTPNICH